MSLDILERINNAFYELTAAERKVSHYILSNPDAIQYMSISQVAEESGVADATVSRFCRRLELKGFYDLKLEIAKHVATTSEIPESGIIVPEVTSNTQNQQIGKTSQDAIQQTIDLADNLAIKKAVTLMEMASRVVCMGSGGSMIMAHECAHLFSTVSNKFSAVDDSHLQMSCIATLEKNDTIILFSYSGSTQSSIQILELAKRRSVNTILITRFPKSPAAECADIVLCCGSNEAPFLPGSIPARVAQLVLIDFIFHEFVQRNQKESNETRANIVAALASLHV